MSDLENTGASPEQNVEGHAHPETDGGNQSPDAALEAIYAAHVAGEEVAPGEEQKEKAQEQAQQPDQGKNKGGEQKEGESKAEQPDESLEAPQQWTKAEKEAWKTAPKEVRDALIRRTQQVEEWAKSHGEEFKAARQFSEQMRPIGEAIHEMKPFLESVQGPDGMPLWGNSASIAHEFKELSRIKTELMRSPAQGLKNIITWARQNGLDMHSAIADVIQDAGSWQDSEIVRAQAEAERQRMRAQKLEERQQEIYRQEVARRNIMESSQAISGLADSKGEDGLPSYPHLHGEFAHDVGQMVGAYIKAHIQAHGGQITQKLFNDAYQSAVWGYEPVRAAEQKRLEDSRVEQYKQNSERAKRAAGVIPGNPGSNAPRYETMTQDEAMQAVWEKFKS